MRLKFGAFLAPFHATGDNPSLALHRDLELVQWMDQLGFDEAWIGEHHSSGWEYLPSPEIFIGVAAERTRNIKLGTGVVSLPYHHPLWVADRITLLDHLTRGRVLFGVGPGALVTDAWQMGIDPNRTRHMMDEALEAILALFTQTEPVNRKTDWFELRNAVLQLPPYTDPYPPVSVASISSPAGVAVAGKYGAGILSLGLAQGPAGAIDLKHQWAIAEEAAQAHGRQIRRQDWRIVVTIHLADSHREAMDDVRPGAGRFQLEYFHGVLGRPVPQDVPPDRIIDSMVERGSAFVGTPDECIPGIRRLEEMSGGFGGVLVLHQEWTSREKVLRSYELLARYVAPHFNGLLRGTRMSYEVSRQQQPAVQAAINTAVGRAHEEFASNPRPSV